MFYYDPVEKVASWKPPRQGKNVRSPSEIKPKMYKSEEGSKTEEPGNEEDIADFASTDDQNEFKVDVAADMDMLSKTGYVF